MRKQRRDRKQHHLDSKSHYEMMAEKETDEKAKQEFRRPALRRVQEEMTAEIYCG